MKKYHYTYYSYEEWGRGYIGVRTSKCLPEEDIKYFGSFTDKTFKPTQKIILQVFNTRKEALDAEITLHNFYEVNTNLHFANKAKMTSSGFCTEGAPISLEHRQKISKKVKGLFVGERHPMFGKKHSKKTRDLISKHSKANGVPQHHIDLLHFLRRNPKVWDNAYKLYLAWIKYDKPGSYKLSKLLGKEYTHKNLERICQKFKSGWIPTEFTSSKSVS
jgi:hypothetical protein